MVKIKKTNLLFIDLSVVIGGAETFLMDLINCLLSKNYNLELIANLNSYFFNSENLKNTKTTYINSSTINLSLRSIKNIKKQIFDIHSILRNKNCVVISNTNRSHLLLFYYYLFRKKINIYFFLHDFLFPKMLISLFKNNIHFNFLPISKSIANHYNISTNIIIHNGFNFDKIKPRFTKSELSKRYSLNESSRWVLGVGGLIKWKGVDQFIKAANEFDKEKLPTEFIWIGNSVKGALDYSSELNLLIKQLRIKNLHIIEPNSHIYDFIYHSENYISCSLDKHGGPESFGRVLIESMFLNTPVISTNVGGPIEFISNGHNGLLVNPGNTTDLVDAIKFYRNENKAKEKIIKNANFTASQYSIDKTTVKLLEIIQG